MVIVQRVNCVATLLWGAKLLRICQLCNNCNHFSFRVLSFYGILRVARFFVSLRTVTISIT